MKRNTKRIFAACLSAALISGTLASPVMAEESSETTKDESVYTILNSDGSVDETIVSDHIHNDNGINNISETLNLKDVENVKTNDEPKVDGNTYTWNLDSDDVYYQGTSNEELPLNVNIKYYLDGNEISADKIAGKSGKVKIVIKVENTETKTVTLNGKNVTIHPLFIAGGVVTMDSDVFSDVKTTSGSVTAEGNSNIVTFAAIPGITDTLESAGLQDKIGDDLSVSDEITITAEAKDFELGSIYIGASDDFDTDKLSEIDSLEELSDGVDELESAASQLSDGTSQLSEGGETFFKNMTTFNTGVQSLSDGVSKLDSLVSGVSKIATGSKQISDGLSKLDSAASEGLSDVIAEGGSIDTLISSVKQLKTGDDQVWAGIQQIYTKIHTKSSTTGMDFIESVQSIGNGLSQLQTGINALSNIKSTGLDLSTTEKQQTFIYYLMQQGYSQSDAVAITTQIATNDGTLAALKQAGVDTTSLAQSYAQLKSGYDSLEIALLGENKDGTGGLVGGIDTLYAGEKQLNAGITQLSTSIDDLKTMKTSLSTMLDSIALLDTNMSTLNDGIQKINTSTSKLSALSKGVTKISSASQKLTDASETLSDKLGELDDGMQEFKTSGIDKLASELSDSDIDLILQIKDQMIALNNEQEAFSGAPKGAEVDTKYIFKTAEIKAEK